MKFKQSSNVDYLQELLSAGRFGIVGLFATTVHIATFWLSLTFAKFTPLLANSLAFLAAFWISFIGNYLWTFRSPGCPRHAMFRFFVIAVSAFVVNTLILAFLVHKGWFSPIISVALTASLVSVGSFSASQRWGFARGER